MMVKHEYMTHVNVGSKRHHIISVPSPGSVLPYGDLCAGKMDNWESQLDPIGSIGFALLDDRREEFYQARDTRT